MLYIGGYAAENNRGIYELNDDLSLNCHICEDEGTSYFDVDEDIYTISKKENQGGVAIYDKKGQCKGSRYFNLKPACFIEKHQDKLYVAYYHDSCVQVFDLKLNLLYQLDYPKNSKCHQVFFMADKMGVVALGLDKIFLYDEKMNLTDELDFPKGSGPRHAIANVEKNELYVVSELNNQLFIVDMKKKYFKQILSIQESDLETTGAALRISQDQKHLYTSTRGQNLIKHFAYEDEWKEVQCIHLNGNHPRDFNLFDHFLVVGYQNSNFVEKYELVDHWIGKRIGFVEYEKIVCVK